MTFKTISIRFFFLLIINILFNACTDTKKLIYFQGNTTNSQSNSSYSLVLQTGDILSITVMGLDETSTKPFNMPTNNINQNIGGYVQGSQSPPGYLIDKEGNITFPVIGKIKLGGLERSDAIDILKEQLKPYLVNPTILIRILNFKVTVLGEVRNPGTFTIPNERITLPEALGIAGDLQITGIRKNIMIIREIEGKRTEYRVDLTSKELFNSPVYFLQQNDVVYVQPNRAKINSSVVNTSNVSLIISTISILITLAALLTR